MDLSEGSIITTTADAGQTDWTPDARQACQWGERGVVQRVSNSHGLCYEVEHNDGRTAWYGPTELVPLSGLYAEVEKVEAQFNADLAELSARYLGRNGKIDVLIARTSSLSRADRILLGKLLNRITDRITRTASK